MLNEMKFRITGTAPLIMHNGQLADPTNTHTIAIAELTGKKSKTAQDHLDIKRLEWFGSLYTEDGRIVLPADNIIKSVTEGSTKHRQTPQAKAGIFETKSSYPLTYKGSKDLDKLYETDGFVFYRSVVISRRRIMRSRPIFAEWSCEFGLMVDESIVKKTKDVTQWVETAGQVVGIGDWHPRYGRFTIESL